MATVASAIANLPVIYQSRYSTQFVSWFNELLEELSTEGLLPSLVVEAGFIVDNDIWITKPSGLQGIQRIWNPKAIDQEYNWEDVNGKIKLKDAIVPEESSPATISTFSSFLTTGFTGNLTGKTEDQYKDYLLVVTAGTWAGRTYLISGNDASGASTTKFYFTHTLSTAMTGTTVTAGYLVSPENYVMIKYLSSFTPIAATSETNPIDAEYQIRITLAWFEWRAARRVSPEAEATLEAKAEYLRILDQVKNKTRKMNGPVIPRFSPGFSQYSGRNSDMIVVFERDS